MSAPPSTYQADLSRREEMAVSGAAMSDAPWKLAGTAGVIVTAADMVAHLIFFHLEFLTPVSLGIAAFFAVAGAGALVRSRHSRALRWARNRPWRFAVMPGAAAAIIVFVLAVLDGSGVLVASALAPRRAAVQATPKDSTTPTSGTTAGTSSGTASSSSDVTANDFLTLLVSELQNQDPTQPTDPNEYITQLAQVNSLQQLISINQGIGTLDGAVSNTSPSTSPAGPSPTSDSVPGANVVAAVTNSNAELGPQPVTNQNAIWGGSTAS